MPRRERRRCAGAALAAARQHAAEAAAAEERLTEHRGHRSFERRPAGQLPVEAGGSSSGKAQGRVAVARANKASNGMEQTIPSPIASNWTGCDTLLHRSGFLSMVVSTSLVLKSGQMPRLRVDQILENCGVDGDGAGCAEETVMSCETREATCPELGGDSSAARRRTFEATSRSLQLAVSSCSLAPVEIPPSKGFCKTSFSRDVADVSTNASGMRDAQHAGVSQ